MLDTSAPERDRDSLPRWLERYRVYALYGLLVGTVLCLFALFTNPIPDPSFPGVTLPASLRLPVRQPRIEHWPVTYTVGIWLWIVGFPALILNGYLKYGAAARRGPALWLGGAPAAAMLGWTTYCRFFWPKLHPPTWNAPSYTIACWGYCSTYDALWSNLAYAIALLGVAATVAAVRRRRGAPHALVAFGALALPLGLPALYEGYRRATQ